MWIIIIANANGKYEWNCCCRAIELFRRPHPPFAGPMTIETLVQDGTFTEYQFGQPNTGTAQSGYTLCWSASPSSTADFTLTLGQMSVTGPNEQNVACTFGLSCVLQLVGFQLESTNKMIVLSAGECGDNAPTLSSVTGMLNCHHRSQANRHMTATT